MSNNMYVCLFLFVSVQYTVAVVPMVGVHYSNSERYPTMLKLPKKE